MNIQIRPLEEQDAYTSVKWRNTPELWGFTKFKAEREITITDELNWIRKVIVDPTCRRFAILVDNTYVGNTYLTGIAGGGAEFHIVIGDPRYWGKGVAQAASRLVIDYAATQLGLSHIGLEVHAENKPAIAVYTKLGFLQVGVDGEFLIMKLDLTRRTKS